MNDPALLDIPTNPEPIGIEDFLEAYIECALWTSTDDQDIPMDRDHSAEDIAPEALRSMREDCVAFLTAMADGVDSVDSDVSQEITNTGRAGHDFWLTRNGHGAGFWDGDWPEPAATRLTDASHGFGESYLYIGDDKLIHVSP